MAALAFVVVWISTAIYLGGHPARAFPHAPFLEGWVRWDAGWYLDIAGHGYAYAGPHKQSSVAFFPGYPLTMRWIGGIVGDEALAGIVTTLVCGLGVAVLFWRWCAEQLSARAAPVALLVLLLYPFGFYLLGAVYADALFVVATLGAFLLLEHDHPVLAGVAGAVATATRPVGLAVLVGLVARTLERRLLPRIHGRLAWHRLRAVDGGVLLSVAGLIAYVVYLGVRFGEPLAFEHVAGAKGWDQAPGPRTWFKVHLLYALVHPPWRFVDYSRFVQAALTLGALLLVPWVYRRFGWGYAAYTVAIVVVPALSTKDFTGMGRYLLAAFPCFAVLGERLVANRSRALAYLSLSTASWVAALVLYTQAVYVS